MWNESVKGGRGKRFLLFRAGCGVSPLPLRSSGEPGERGRVIGYLRQAFSRLFDYGYISRRSTKASTQISVVLLPLLLLSRNQAPLKIPDLGCAIPGPVPDDGNIAPPHPPKGIHTPVKGTSIPDSVVVEVQEPGSVAVDADLRGTIETRSIRPPRGPVRSYRRRNLARRSGHPSQIPLLFRSRNQTPSR